MKIIELGIPIELYQVLSLMKKQLKMHLKDNKLEIISFQIYLQ